jgi:hypothetical protein
VVREGLHRLHGLAVRTVASPPNAQRFHEEFALLLKKHLADEQPEVLLAVASYAVGQLVALQDQATMTPERAMRIVAANIEAGNHSAIGPLLDTKGTA